MWWRQKCRLRTTRTVRLCLRHHVIITSRHSQITNEVTAWDKSPVISVIWHFHLNSNVLCGDLITCEVLAKTTRERQTWWNPTITLYPAVAAGTQLRRRWHQPTNWHPRQYQDVDHTIHEQRDSGIASKITHSEMYLTEFRKSNLVFVQRVDMDKLYQLKSSDECQEYFYNL